MNLMMMMMTVLRARQTRLAKEYAYRLSSMLVSFVQRCILHIDTRGWSGIIYRRMPQVARGRGISRAKAVLKDEHKVREIRFGD